MQRQSNRNPLISRPVINLSSHCYTHGYTSILCTYGIEQASEHPRDCVRACMFMSKWQLFSFAIKTRDRCIHTASEWLCMIYNTVCVCVFVLVLALVVISTRPGCQNVSFRRIYALSFSFYVVLQYSPGVSLTFCNRICCVWSMYECAIGRLYRKRNYCFIF